MKNQDKPWIEVMEICRNHSKEALWAYASALRGPDIMESITMNDRRLETIFTCPLRVRNEIFIDVKEYKRLSLKDIESVFIYLSDTNNKYKYLHYLEYVRFAWSFLNPKVADILSELMGTILDEQEDRAKALACKYKEYVDEWLNSERVINQEYGGAIGEEK